MTQTGALLAKKVTVGGRNSLFMHMDTRTCKLQTICLLNSQPIPWRVFLHQILRKNRARKERKWSLSTLHASARQLGSGTALSQHRLLPPKGLPRPANDVSSPDLSRRILPSTGAVNAKLDTHAGNRCNLHSNCTGSTPYQQRQQKFVAATATIIANFQ